MPASDTQQPTNTKRLSDGNLIPLLALGVWQIPDGPECVNAVRAALEAGYRHIDTAQDYGNEASVGRAVRESGIAREEIFVTTKFEPGHRSPLAEAENSLRLLGLDHVDLYLVHWPQGGPTWAWPEMEESQRRGYARSIGVSNFSVDEVDQLLKVGGSAPVVNQVEFSPFEYRRGLVSGCSERGIAVEAYSPLGTGRHLSDPIVSRVAERLDRTPAQVLLRWCVQRDVIVLPKSTHRDRIAQNAAIFDFVLSEEDVTALDALDTTGGTAQACETPWW
jgi:diketogulonate reductase-like aldo/keto reductase